MADEEFRTLCGSTRDDTACEKERRGSNQATKAYKDKFLQHHEHGNCQCAMLNTELLLHHSDVSTFVPHIGYVIQKKHCTAGASEISATSLIYIMNNRQDFCYK